MLKKMLSLSFQRFIPFLKSSQSELATLFIIFYPISLYFFLQMETFQNPTPDMEMQRIITMFSQATVEYLVQVFRALLFMTLIFRMLYPEKFQARGILAVIKKNYLQVLIEYLRCVLAIAIRVPLLLLPAFYEYVRLLFVGHVVIFNKEYAKGQVDALQESREIFSKHRWSIIGGWLFSLALYLAFNAIAIQLVPSGVFQHFLIYTGSFLIDIIPALFFASYFFEIVSVDRLGVEE